MPSRTIIFGIKEGLDGDVGKLVQQVAQEISDILQKPIRSYEKGTSITVITPSKRYEVTITSQTNTINLQNGKKDINLAVVTGEEGLAKYLQQGMNFFNTLTKRGYANCPQISEQIPK
ncbi:hypothetical protein HYV83_00155 [Candidatus Woesearchaeota archaeon]|nr:hypothetical protein [Candidatus Woesearchaeota archaeon]